MSEEHFRSQVKVATAKILFTNGWETSYPISLEVLADILIHYVDQLAQFTRVYTKRFGVLHPTLDHLAMVFKLFHIDLEEKYYVTLKHSPSPIFVQNKYLKYLFIKEELTDMKVITGPLNLHVAIPYILRKRRVKRRRTGIIMKSEISETDVPLPNAPLRSMKYDPIDMELYKKRRINEGECRLTREIISAKMTDSGTIIPSREGKLPEAVINESIALELDLEIIPINHTPLIIS